MLNTNHDNRTVNALINMNLQFFYSYFHSKIVNLWQEDNNLSVEELMAKYGRPGDPDLKSEQASENEEEDQKNGSSEGSDSDDQEEDGSEEQSDEEEEEESSSDDDIALSSLLEDKVRAVQKFQYGDNSLCYKMHFLTCMYSNSKTYFCLFNVTLAVIFI